VNYLDKNNYICNMKVRILKPIKGRKWKVGEWVEVSRQLAKELINAGLASEQKPHVKLNKKNDK